MFSVYSESLLYFNFFYHNFMIYIYIYIYIYLVLYFFFNFLNIMTSDYLSKHFNFICTYNGLFSNFCYYKCLNSNTSKHLKIMYKRFLKYASKQK